MRDRPVAPVFPPRIPLILALVATLLIAGCFGEDLPTVSTEPVRSAEVTQTVSAPGRVAAAAEQSMRAELPATVLAVQAQDGQAVRAGETIVRLGSAELEEALAQARRARADIEDLGGITVGQVEVGALPTPSNPAAQAVQDLDATVLPQIQQARETVASVSAQAPAAFDELPESVTAAAADVPDPSAAEASLGAVEETYRGVRQALLAAGQAAVEQQRAANAQLDDLAAQVTAQLDEALSAAVGQVAAAQQAQADAAVAQVEEQQEALTVQAPIDGFIQFGGASSAPAPDALGGLEGLEGLGEAGVDLGGLADGAQDAEAVRAGSSVAPGQTLFTVYDTSEWYVEADVDEVDAPQVAEGQRVSVAIDAFPGAEFEGVVESVQLDASQSPTGGVSYPTRIRLIDPPEGGRVGMTASAEIITQTVEAELAVPSRAIVRRDGQTVVHTVRDDGTVGIVSVTVVALGDDLAAVEGDLRVGQVVVVTGYEDLSDGDAVQVE